MVVRASTVLVVLNCLPSLARRDARLVDEDFREVDEAVVAGAGLLDTSEP